MTVKDVLELEEVKDVLQDFGEVLIFYDNKVYEMDNIFLNCQVKEWENDFNVYINIYLANKPNN